MLGEVGGDSSMDFEGHSLVPFQEEDKAWLRDHKRAMLLYDRGLGKTVVSIKRCIDEGVGTHIVVGPKNSMRTWRDHTTEWFAVHRPNTTLELEIVLGDPHSRGQVWNRLLRPEAPGHHRLFATTYHTLYRDLPQLISDKHLRFIDHVSLDEAHRIGSHRERQKTKDKSLGPGKGPLSMAETIARLLLKQLPTDSTFTYNTGTPISRGPHEFWRFLNTINPKMFSSYWRHTRMFCEVVDGVWGPEIIGPRNLDNWHILLKMFARVRLKSDPKIAAQMPAKVRKPLFVELDDKQYDIYRRLEVDKLVWIDETGNVIVAATSMEAVMRFRQLLVCPAILDESLGLGAAFNDFLDTWSNADSTDRHTVVFTPFKRAFSHFKQAIESRGGSVSELSGAISVKEQDEQIARWRATRGVMLCTIPYAESFDLDPRKPGDATTAYFIGYEWNPNQNAQAEDRLHRLVTQYPVTMHYYRYEGTVDDGLCYAVNWKQQNINLTLDGARTLIT